MTATAKLVSELDQSVITQVTMRLNPILMMKDYQALAGKMGYKYYEIKAFGLERNPTAAVLESWWSQKGDRSVNALIKILESIERYDVTELLEHHRYVGMLYQITDKQCKKLGLGLGYPQLR